MESEAGKECSDVAMAGRIRMMKRQATMFYTLCRTERKRHMEIENLVKNLVLGLGADLCGIANADAFAGAPEGFRPTDIFEPCRAVVVFAKSMPRGTACVAPRIVYNRANDVNTLEVDRMGLLAARALEDLNMTAVPLPADSPYDYWDEERLEGRGILSMRHAAVLAGLGRFGKNTLVINERFGNMITIGAILVDRDLTTDSPAKDLCIVGCRRCLDACPQNALGGASVIQKRCRPHTYETNARGFGVVNCNVCRIVCPMRFGLGKHKAAHHFRMPSKKDSKTRNGGTFQ